MWGGRETTQAPLRLIFGLLTLLQRLGSILRIKTMSFITPALQTHHGLEKAIMTTVNTSNDLVVLNTIDPSIIVNDLMVQSSSIHSSIIVNDPMDLNSISPSIIDNGLTGLNSIDSSIIGITWTGQGGGTEIKTTGLRAVDRFKLF